MKGKLKRLLCLIAAVAIAMAVLGCSQKTAEAIPADKSSGSPISVNVSIDGSAAEADGFKIGGSMDVQLTDGDSALDALISAADALGYEVKCKGDYVTHIGDLGEKSCGPNSGWMFDVNGDMPNESSEKFIVKDGDKVTFTFWK